MADVDEQREEVQGRDQGYVGEGEERVEAGEEAVEVVHEAEAGAVQVHGRGGGGGEGWRGRERGGWGRKKRAQGKRRWVDSKDRDAGGSGLGQFSALFVWAVVVWRECETRSCGTVAVLYPWVPSKCIYSRM